MNSKKVKGSASVQNLEGSKHIRLQGSKKRSAIYVNRADAGALTFCFEKIPKTLINEFTLEEQEGTFDFPGQLHLELIVGFLKEKCSEIQAQRLMMRIRRQKRIRKRSEERMRITYRHIRILYQDHQETMAEIASFFKLSRKTVSKILKSYKNLTIGDPELDKKEINRTKSHKKYLIEADIIDFIRDVAKSPNFDRSVTGKDIIGILHNKFGQDRRFKLSTVYKWIHQAGLRRKKVRIDVYSKKNTPEFNDDQKTHLAKLAFAIYAQKLIVYLDETYVSNQMCPSKLWS